MGNDMLDLAEYREKNKEAAEKMRRKYRTVFGGPDGKAVLADILWLLEFDVISNDVETTARQNAAKRILQRCGAWGDPDLIVDKLMGGHFDG